MYPELELNLLKQSLIIIGKLSGSVYGSNFRLNRDKIKLFIRFITRLVFLSDPN